MESIDPYSPCPCGSGKKYKFCCLQKRRENASGFQNPFAFSLSSTWAGSGSADEGNIRSEIDACMAVCKRGLRFMAAGRYEEAIPIFEEAQAISSIVYTAANNLALCLFAMGNPRKALAIQRKSLKASPFPNPFGLCNLATFDYVLGNEVNSRRHLNEALKLTVPSTDSCIKVCETLARFHRHQEILDFAAASGYGDDPIVCFFTGVAAANLGLFERAQRDLIRVPSSFFKASMAERYVRHLREGSAPHTVRRDWPYLLRGEICPDKLLETNTAEEEDDVWMAWRIAVDYCEALLNELADDPTPVIDILAGLKHPAATELLWVILKGSFGPDELRSVALQLLKEQNAIKPDESVEMLIGGQRREIVASKVELAPGYLSSQPLSKALAKQYQKAIRASAKKRPDWVALANEYRNIARAAPHFYPALFNYAMCLLNLERRTDAKKILRGLVKAHPEYLYARATLLEVLSEDRRFKESKTLVETAIIPEKVRPSDLALWYTAKTFYYEDSGLIDDAYHSIEMAHQTDPGNKRIKELWSLYQDWADDLENE